MKKKKYLINILYFIVLSLSLTGCVPMIIAGTGVATTSVIVSKNSISAETEVSDKQIQMNAISIVRETPVLNKGKSDVEPVVFNGLLLILGQVPTKALSQRLAKAMSEIQGVKIVYNQLTVGSALGVTDYLHDSWITSRVITSLTYHNLDAGKFKVVTEGGVVYLLGVVKQAYGQRAAEVAAKIAGVKKVIKLITSH